MTTPRHLSATAAARRLPLVLASLMLAGCASFSPDGGFGAVEQVARDRLGKDALWARTTADQDRIDTRVAELLARPLTVDDAVQVALLNNKGLQARFFELGIGEAELVQSSRLPNPGFSFGRLRRGGEIELERGYHLDLAHLLAMPLVRQVEERRFAQTRGAVAVQLLALASEARKAYVTAVAAEETVRYGRQVQQAAEAGAELARRMVEVGNFNKLQRLREQSFYADATLSLARAERAASASREKLTRLMGLWGTQTQFQLPERLPDLPEAPEDQPDIERAALAQRLDVQGARLAAEQTAKSLGLTKTTRFVNVLELGWAHNSSNEEPTQTGWEVGLELPLFDWGGARVARAEAVYMQALNRAAETAVNARSEVREAYGAYRLAWDIAHHHRDEIVPLRQHIAEENVLRYNGMLIGVFDLLADARLQIASVNACIESLRDFWLAQADLEMALIGRPGLSGGGMALGNDMAAGSADAGGGH
ncbi:TolC family protein [Methylibium petroleiphilum]|uniref:TolC family protein n=1 Tax=Methylibium petroleiphilum TaxID=105560 RepID=UPI003D2BBAF3